jgi:predicted O-methyltransferase YrrM
MTWYRYSDLVDAIKALVGDDDLRLEIETDALASIAKQDFTASVSQALQGGDHARHSDSTAISAIPGGAPSRVNGTSAIQLRYQRGCEQGDMKDFLPLLRSVAKGQILEIGVRDGASTSALLLGLEQRGGYLTSVDIQDCSGLWTHPQWRVLCQDSKLCVFDEGVFDLVFIDGDHSPEGFRRDLENCIRWVRPGGLILCHDISPLPNYTAETRGGDWPSQYVGEEFLRMVEDKKLRSFIYPGAWGLGVIIRDSQ